MAVDSPCPARRLFAPSRVDSSPRTRSPLCRVRREWFGKCGSVPAPPAFVAPPSAPSRSGSGLRRSAGLRRRPSRSSGSASAGLILAHEDAGQAHQRLNVAGNHLPRTLVVRLRLVQIASQPRVAPHLTFDSRAFSIHAQRQLQFLLRIGLCGRNWWGRLRGWLPPAQNARREGTGPSAGPRDNGPRRLSDRRRLTRCSATTSCMRGESGASSASLFSVSSAISW